MKACGEISVDKIATSQPAEPFLSSVLAVKEAEDEAQLGVSKAKERSGRLVAAAREKAVEITAKAQDNAVKEKNRIIAQGRADTSKQVKKIADDAKKRASHISSAKLPDPHARGLAESIRL